MSSNRFRPSMPTSSGSIGGRDAGASYRDVLVRLPEEVGMEGRRIAHQEILR